MDDGLSDYSDSVCEGGRRYTANYRPPHSSCKPILRPTDDGQVWVRKEHRNNKGLAPLCYIATDYDGEPGPDGDSHQAYLCCNKTDIEWARRLRFHLNRIK